MTHLIYLFFAFLSLSSAAETIATIDDKALILTTSTSCARNKWATDEGACTCCLIKNTMPQNSKKMTADGAVRHCSEERNYCSAATLAQLNSHKDSNSDFIKKLQRSVIENPEVALKPDSVDTKGALTEEGVKDLLSRLAIDDGFKAPERSASFKNSDCINVKNLGKGGAFTAQLFLVDVDKKCPGGPRGYVLKEPAKKLEEILNLRTIALSPLFDYDLTNPKREQNDIAIASDVQNFTYRTRGQIHYLTLMDRAPGIPFMQLVDNFAETLPNHTTMKQDYVKQQKKMIAASYQFGLGLGRLHRRFMEPGPELLGKTYTHGDLHMDNFFVSFPDDGSSPLITFIDNETFARSLRAKESIEEDLIYTYGFSVSSKEPTHNHAVGIPGFVWHSVFVKPFLQGYMAAWPASDYGFLWTELNEIFLGGNRSKIGSRRLFLIALIGGAANDRANLQKTLQELAPK